MTGTDRLTAPVSEDTFRKADARRPPIWV